MEIVYERDTGICVDFGARVPEYDPDKFVKQVFPDGTLPDTAVSRKFRREPDGTIVRRPTSELTREFPDEDRTERTRVINTAINALTITDEIKQVLRMLMREAIR